MEKGTGKVNGDRKKKAVTSSMKNKISVNTFNKPKIKKTKQKTPESET